MPSSDFLAATLPLFENDEVDVLEWSPDIGWVNEESATPAWVDGLLKVFSDNHRLLGHGVDFSPLSVDWSAWDSTWLQNLKNELKQRTFTHFSEHFGCAHSASYERGSPFPVPYSSAAVTVGRKKLETLATATGVRIGLENLALAFGKSDVRDQGQFLDDLLSPFDGFLVLDLHNLYCQLANFEEDASALLDSYPLARVREIHVSGGSWSEPSPQFGGRSIRRDTHNGSVPETVFSLLPLALAKCANVEAVILERLGDTMHKPGEQEKFRQDYRELAKLINSSPAVSSADFLQAKAVVSPRSQTQPATTDVSEEELRLYQNQLQRRLDSKSRADLVIDQLKADSSISQNNSLANYVSNFEPRMIEVGQELMKKWSRRAAAQPFHP